MKEIFNIVKSVVNSPFKRPRLKWYLGKIAIGVPYFFPRKFIPDPEKPGYEKAIPKRFGFDFVSLGYKTKWSDTDYRIEWEPKISFIFFKYQLAIMIYADYPDNFWASWLYYNGNTDKNLSKKERIKKCVDEFPQTYMSYCDGNKKTVNYYEKILKRKYVKFSSRQKERDSKLEELGI